jgi:hypothetical protein
MTAKIPTSFEDEFYPEIKVFESSPCENIRNQAKVMRHYLAGGKVLWKDKVLQNWEEASIHGECRILFWWATHDYKIAEDSVVCSNAKETSSEDPVQQFRRYKREDLQHRMEEHEKRGEFGKVAIIKHYLEGGTIYWRSKNPSAKGWNSYKFGDDHTLSFNWSNCEYSTTDPNEKKDPEANSEVSQAMQRANLMLCYASGGKVEWRLLGTWEWDVVTHADWNFNLFEYRLAPVELVVDSGDGEVLIKNLPKHTRCKITVEQVL